MKNQEFMEKIGFIFLVNVNQFWVVKVVLVLLILMEILKKS